MSPMTACQGHDMASSAETLPNIVMPTVPLRSRICIVCRHGGAVGSSTSQPVNLSHAYIHKRRVIC